MLFSENHFFIIKNKKVVQFKKMLEIYITQKCGEFHSMLHPRSKAVLPKQWKRDVLQNLLWDSKENRVRAEMEVVFNQIKIVKEKKIPFINYNRTAWQAGI